MRFKARTGNGLGFVSESNGWKDVDEEDDEIGPLGSKATELTEETGLSRTFLWPILFLAQCVVVIIGPDLRPKRDVIKDTLHFASLSRSHTDTRLSLVTSVLC